MSIEKFFEEQKGISVDAAFKMGAKYTAVDICRFARDYHESMINSQVATKEVDVVVEVVEKTTHQKALDWWDELELSEKEDIEREFGFFGHDIGTNEADIEYFYTEKFK